ncbi:unnamed protein product [Calicophoron daubneyi]|uniref:RGS domain-containing protein n=1 Tax=Calicophoron daubneyi TaxID=300641 RepID=A0AAV2TW63_CALDB
MKTPFFWVSNIWIPDSVDHAIFLCKIKEKSKKHGMEMYERAEFERLQKTLADKWEFIEIQAKEQGKLDRRRRKLDRLILFLQERAFWRVHHPPPGMKLVLCEQPPRFFTMLQMKVRAKNNKNPAPSRCLNAYDESEIKMICVNATKRQDSVSHTPQHGATNPNSKSNSRFVRSGENKTLESIITYASANMNYDWFTDQSLSQNPWMYEADDKHTWPEEVTISSDSGEKDHKLNPSLKQVRMWGADFVHLIKDPLGRAWLEIFMQKEYSCENLRFWLAVNEYKFGPLSNVEVGCKKIYDEFLCSNGQSEVNIENKTRDITELAVQSPTLFSYDDAQQHIYEVIKEDTYARFLKSSEYKQALNHAIQAHEKKMRSSPTQ